MIKRTVRTQTYTIKTYLGYVHEGDICDNADVQRLAGSFDSRELNEIIYTVLTDDHIPEIILAECNEDNRTYIADGLQRTTMLKKFLYGNYKITSAIDNSIVEYMRKKRDENNKIMKNKRGQIEYEEAEFDIKNKTYEMLPEELQKVFNDFQLNIVIHEDCTMKRISELIKRYNAQKPMSAPQKAFTYIDNYATSVRDILNERFFIQCAGYTENEKINGTMERVVTESVMYMFHLDEWKKSPKAVCEYLNKKSNLKEFEEFQSVVHKLGEIITPEFNRVFISKNSFIWFSLFRKFLQYGESNDRFAEFVSEFNQKLHSKIVTGITYKEMDNITYDKLDKENGTKDRSLITAKYSLVEKLMMEYFHIKTDMEVKRIDPEAFIVENVGVETDTHHEDIELYNQSLDDMLDKYVKDGSKLKEDNNRLSLLSMVAYSYKIDADLDDWLQEYAKNNNTYLMDQKRNYLHMKKEFDEYIAKYQRTSA